MQQYKEKAIVGKSETPELSVTVQNRITLASCKSEVLHRSNRPNKMISKNAFTLLTQYPFLDILVMCF